MHVYGIVETNIKSYDFKANILGGRGGIMTQMNISSG